MKHEYIKLDKVTKGDLRKRISKDFNIPHKDIRDEILPFIENFLETKATEQEYIEKQIERPPVPSDKYVIKALVRVTPSVYYHVNVKKTTWILLGLLLDIYLTKGIATATLTCCGVVGKTIARLSPKNGEVCIYYQALSLKKDRIKKFEGKDVFDKIVKKNCPYQKLECMYCKEIKCSIRPEHLEDIFQSLRKKSAFLQAQDNKWQVPL